MSVIHEALKRAERERSAGLAPQSADPPLLAVNGAVAPQRWRQARVAAAVSGALLILAGAYWALDRGNQAPSPPATAATAAHSSLPKPSDMSPAPGTTVPVAPDQAVISRSRATGASPPAAVPGTAPAPAAAPGLSPDPARLNSEAVAAFREGRPEAARRLIEQALRLAPAMPEAHNNFGMILQAQGQRMQAKEEFHRALALLPDYPEALNNLGIACSAEENQGEAILSFEQALRSRPGYSSAHLNLAIVYDKLGKRTEALSHYRKFLEYAGPEEKDLVRGVTARIRK